MRKAIALVENDHTLGQFVKGLDQLTQTFKQRHEFLEKQMKDNAKEGENQSKAIWVNIKEYFREKNLLPDDYSDDKYHFHFDPSGTVVFICDGAEHENRNPLESLFRQIGVKGGIIELPFPTN